MHERTIGEIRGLGYVCESEKPSVRFGLVRLALDLLGDGELRHVENIFTGLLRNPVFETEEELLFFNEVADSISQYRSSPGFDSYARLLTDLGAISNGCPGIYNARYDAAVSALYKEDNKEFKSLVMSR